MKAVYEQRQLVSATECSAVFGLSVATLRTMVKSGKFPVQRFPTTRRLLWTRRAVADYLGLTLDQLDRAINMRRVKAKPKKKKGEKQGKKKAGKDKPALEVAAQKEAAAK